MRFCLLVLACSLSVYLRAAEVYRDAPYEDIRWLGRGNTGVAVVRDFSSMFYNPAGLGRSGRFAFDLLNPAFGISDKTYGNIKSLTGLGGTNDSLSSKFEPFLGQPLSFNFQTFPAIVVPYFGFGGFGIVDARAEYRNPVSPEFTISERDDKGFIGGFGLPVFPGLYVGASVRWFKRRTIDQSISGASLLDLNPRDLLGFSRQGSGYGLNLGAQFELPISEHQSFNLGLSVEDLGNTMIRSSKGKAPLNQDQSINLGVAYSFDTEYLGAKVLFDARNLGEGDHYSTGKMLYQGVEVNFLKLDLRAGLYHGYWTAGLSVRWLHVLRFDFSTYAEELDSNLGLRANRMYMVGISAGVDINSTSGKKQKYTLDHL